MQNVKKFVGTLLSTDLDTDKSQRNNEWRRWVEIERAKATMRSECGNQTRWVSNQKPSATTSDICGYIIFRDSTLVTQNLKFYLTIAY